MMIRIDKAKAIELLTEIIEEAGPEARYERPGDNTDGCFYVHRYDSDGHFVGENRLGVESREPGCIIGRLLINIGVPMKWFDRCEGHFSSTMTDYLRDENFADITFDAARLMRKVQCHQDNAKTWKESLELAIRGE